MGCDNVKEDGKILNCRGKTIKISYVPKSEISPAYGRSLSGSGEVLVRNDLSPDIKRHVLIHEINHLLGRDTEKSANVSSFFVDPKGWVKTASATLSDTERIRMYLRK